MMTTIRTTFAITLLFFASCVHSFTFCAIRSTLKEREYSQQIVVQQEYPPQQPYGIPEQPIFNIIVRNNSTTPVEIIYPIAPHSHIMQTIQLIHNAPAFFAAHCCTLIFKSIPQQEKINFTNDISLLIEQFKRKSIHIIDQDKQLILKEILLFNHNQKKTIAHNQHAAKSKRPQRPPESIPISRLYADSIKYEPDFRRNAFNPCPIKQEPTTEHEQFTQQIVQTPAPVSKKNQSELKFYFSPDEITTDMFNINAILTDSSDEP